jgi:hypothetical protein
MARHPWFAQPNFNTRAPQSTHRLVWFKDSAKPQDMSYLLSDSLNLRSLEPYLFSMSGLLWA